MEQPENEAQDSLNQEYVIDDSGLFVIIKKKDHNIDEISEGFSLKTKEKAWKKNVLIHEIDPPKESDSIRSERSDVAQFLNSFIEDTVCPWKSKQPKYLVLLFMADESYFSSSKDYVRMIHTLSDKFLGIPKIFFMDVCCKGRINWQRVCEEKPGKTLKPSNYLPKSADCYIMFPCIHLDSTYPVHPSTSLVENVVNASQPITKAWQHSIDNSTLADYDLESLSAGWIEDLATMVRARCNEQQPSQSISTLRAKLSWIKILEQQRAYAGQSRKPVKRTHSEMSSK